MITPSDVLSEEKHNLMHTFAKSQNFQQVIICNIKPSNFGL